MNKLHRAMMGSGVGMGIGVGLMATTLYSNDVLEGVNADLENSQEISNRINLIEDETGDLSKKLGKVPETNAELHKCQTIHDHCISKLSGICFEVMDDHEYLRKLDPTGSELLVKLSVVKNSPKIKDALKMENVCNEGRIECIDQIQGQLRVELKGLK